MRSAWFYSSFMSGVPPPHYHTCSTWLLSVPLPLPVHLSPLHTLSTPLVSALLEPVTQQNCQPRWGWRTPKWAVAHTWLLHPWKALFCTCWEEQTRTTCANLDANQAFLPGVDAGQVDLFQGLPTEPEVDPFWGHGELEGHSLVRFRHPGGWWAPGRRQEGARAGSSGPRRSPPHPRRRLHPCLPLTLPSQVIGQPQQCRGPTLGP